jgi:hypothetical protein
MIHLALLIVSAYIIGIFMLSCLYCVGAVVFGVYDAIKRMPAPTVSVPRPKKPMSGYARAVLTLALLWLVVAMAYGLWVSFLRD